MKYLVVVTVNYFFFEMKKVKFDKRMLFFLSKETFFSMKLRQTDIQKTNPLFAIPSFSHSEESKTFQLSHLLTKKFQKVVQFVLKAYFTSYVIII